MGPGFTCPWSGSLSGFRVRTWIEPVVASTQVAGSLYDTGLLLVLKESFASDARDSSNYSANQSLGERQEDQQQKAISNFYIIYNLVVGLTPLLSAYVLGWLSDRYHRKISICTAMLGFLLSRIGLLLKVMLDWPLEVMYGAAALNGLCGGFSAYWSGVMALGSLSCSQSRRSVRLILIDLVLGLAGFCGSMASGHLFKQIVGHSAQGLLLTACSVGCAAFALFYSLFVLKVPEAVSKPNKVHPTVDTVSGMMGTYRTLDPDQQDKPNIQANPPTPGKEKPSQAIIALLFVGAIVYDLAVVGTLDVMALFVLKDPLHWNQVQLGYGMASGYIIFITSFLGVLVFSRYFRDTTMIIIGMVSFGSGALLLAFVKKTYMFYIGKIFVILQLCLALTGVVTSTMYNKIYQLTLNKFAGTCFLLSSFLSFLAIVPIGVVAYKQVPGSRQGECADTQRS
ncbi:solute carrier family 46 member 2 isoform X1 [Rattus norvegicus]|uniref:Solute carrier family 46, member 2 n=1 Tax=Rattus norvegicus TaxID=10116 RepID=A0ABK0LY38_RAT|eukprot:XP_008761956.1 PREDICTED: thymic stromal cotransporter homolog isoform X1 [Rattus norvegicus]